MKTGESLKSSKKLFSCRPTGILKSEKANYALECERKNHILGCENNNRGTLGNERRNSDSFCNKRMRKKKKKKNNNNNRRKSLIRGWCGFKNLNLTSSLHLSADLLTSLRLNGKSMKGINNSKRQTHKQKVKMYTFKPVSFSSCEKVHPKSEKVGNNITDPMKNVLWCYDITFNPFAFYYLPYSYTLFSFSPPQSDFCLKKITTF